MADEGVDILSFVRSRRSANTIGVSRSNVFYAGMVIGFRAAAQSMDYAKARVVSVDRSQNALVVANLPEGVKAGYLIAYQEN